MPFQDFTSWLPGETDPNNHITVAADKVTFDLYRNEKAYHVDTLAVPLTGDFKHDIKVGSVGYSSYSAVVFWMVADMEGDISDIIAAGGNALALGIMKAFISPMYTNLWAVTDGVLRVVNSSSITWTIAPYVTLERDDDGGANSQGLLTAKLFADSARLDQRYILSLDLTAKKDFTKVYACSSYYSGQSGHVTGEVSEMNLYNTITPAKRTMIVKAEDRTLIIPAENRILTVPAENRTVLA